MKVGSYTWDDWTVWICATSDCPIEAYDRFSKRFKKFRVAQLEKLNED